MERSTDSVDALRRLAEELQEQAVLARHRRALVLAGEPAWGRELAAALAAGLALEPRVWVGAHSLPGFESVQGRAVLGLLGQERRLLVFDAHDGFDPDGFGAATGCLVGGGLLILLTPPLAEWPGLPDPATARLAMAPFGPADVGGRFLRRLTGLMRAATGLSLVEQGRPLPRPVGAVEPAPPGGAADGFRSHDQREAAAAVERVACGHRRRPLVLVADRGRGKSAALGIAAANLLRRGLRHIVVTAPRLDAVGPLFERAAALLPAAEVKAGRLCLGESRLEFLPPDELAARPVRADLLLVDEAAAIPAPLLTTLLRRHARIVFSTTVHGYEGTGRGFAVRFRETLDRLAPGWRELRLREPVRWAPEDPLERFVFRALLLDAEAADDEQVEAATPSSCRLRRFDRDALAADEATLSQLFGLLVQAHYRTRPGDLRSLLDAPGQQVHALCHDDRVAATALLAAEGGFEEDMAQAIAAGRRRPRGHLIPQSLAFHLGVPAGAQLRCARIMRLAVHPAARRRGLGRRLVDELHREAVSQGFDLLGASFGATGALLDFWQAGDLRPVRLGFTRDHASGARSVMLLRPLSAAGRRVFEEARRRFLSDFPCQLGGPLRDLDPDLAARLLRRLPGEALPEAPAASDLARAAGFAAGGPGLEDCLGPLRRVALHGLADPRRDLPPEARALLVAALLQYRDRATLADMLGVPGKAGVLARLRDALFLVMSHGRTP